MARSTVRVKRCFAPIKGRTESREYRGAHRVTVVQAELDILAPLERVFEAVTDPRRGPEWNPNIIEMGPVDGLPVGIGSSWNQTVSVAGRTMNLHCRVAQFEAPLEGVLDVSGGQQARIVTRCAAVPGATRVTQIVDFVPPGGLMGGLIAGAVKPMVERELHAALARQKATLEMEAGGFSGPGA